MDYRQLGKAGIKVSQLSFGSWVSFSTQLDVKEAMNTMSAARDYGVNFFDNAESYAGGKSEEFMGDALKKLEWPRLSYLISTKFYWGITKDPNGSNTLNRKYLLESITDSLKRLKTDHVDLVYCHRADPHTPMEETVWAMHDMINRGYALYWGTSEWSAEQIREAHKIADKRGFHRPVVEQPQYNLLHRHKVETEFAPLYEEFGMGLTTWSPLASGVLSGKYLEGIPKGTRASMASMKSVADAAQDEKKQKAVRTLVEIAGELECTPAQLAIAWCSKNPRVSSVITGASRVEQVHENMKSLQIMMKLKPGLMEELDRVFPANAFPK